jgi:hypothetical protein
VVILSIVRIENQRLMSCVKTLCRTLQCLFVPWLKALQVNLYDSIKDMSIGYGHVCDEHNGRYQSIKSLLIEGLYYISVENI